MNRLLKVLVVLPAILFLVTGLRWLVAPAGVAPQFGLTLEQGVGLSSQVGDLSAFFSVARYLHAHCAGERTPQLVLPADYSSIAYRVGSYPCLAIA